MTTTPASNVPERIEENIGSFLRALNAPFVATPFLNGETSAPIPRVGNPEVPPGQEPLALPIFTSTGEWEWINEQTFYDIHELAVLHDDRLHRTTVRACRAGDRTLAYINKSWNLDSRHPGIVAELSLYKTALKHQMGEYVPRLIAVRCGSDRFNLGFEIPHQTFFIEASADMPETLKRRTIKVLEKLHAKGICHKDLNLENILIGADGKIYIYNFHHARYIIEQPAVFLERANAADFAWEMRRLNFKLDYENAREKEKIRLGISIDRVRKNYLEIKMQEGDPSYQPKLVEPSQIAKMNPPIDLSKYESWFDDLDREPRRFIMPGQTADDFEWELKRFYNILQKMEDNDVAAGLQRTRVEPSLGQVELPKVENMEGLPDDYMEDSIAIPTDRRSCLKRKRPLEHDGGNKRSRQELQPLLHAPEPPTEGTPGEVERFKYDGLRSGIKLVSCREIHASIQENNLVAHWPIVVVRDYSREPSPAMAGALVLLGKKHREEFREKLEQEKKVHLEEEDPMPTPTSSWNPLRRIFSVFQNDEDEKMEDQEAIPSAPAASIALRRQDTLFYVEAPPLGVWSKSAFRDASHSTDGSDTAGPFRYRRRRFPPRWIQQPRLQLRAVMRPRHDAFPVHAFMAAPLQAVGRVFSNLIRPLSL